MLRDLRDKLSASLNPPIESESKVVYIMVEIRTLMDRQNSQERFPVVKLFCDWDVHTSIERNTAAEPILREFDKAVESLKAGNGIPAEFIHYISLTNFRKQLRAFWKVNGLPIARFHTARTAAAALSRNPHGSKSLSSSLAS